MARTVDHAAHARWRTEILDVAERLVRARGYERTSVQDVLNELGISKGALYHYFPSKQDLLAGLVDRSADQVRARLAEVAERPGISASDKLNQLFQALAGWKAERRDELVDLLRVWSSDGNALLRERTRAGITERLAPVFDAVIDQGAADGSFAVPAGAGFGRVLVSMIHGLNDRLGELFFAHESGRGDRAAVEQAVAANTAAVERVLGAAEGSVKLVDLTALHRWFRPGAKGRRS